MARSSHAESPSPAAAPRPCAPPLRAPYATPQLEPLGRWSALTLQQSIPIGPGTGFRTDPTDATWFA